MVKGRRFPSFAYFAEDIDAIVTRLEADGSFPDARRRFRAKEPELIEAILSEVLKPKGRPVRAPVVDRGAS